eukprot:scaffold21917_cov53-Phaeocystis_antarctica.AAC.2
MADAEQGELPPHEMEEAGAALAGALGGLRTIFAGVVPPEGEAAAAKTALKAAAAAAGAEKRAMEAASGTRTQLGERDPAEEHPAPPPASAGVERNVETTAEEPEAVAAAEAVVEGEAEELLEVAEELEKHEAMSLDKLRDICRHFKLDDKGDKQQLIERLQRSGASRLRCRPRWRTTRTCAAGAATDARAAWAR